MERIERIQRRDGVEPVRLTLLSALEREQDRQERERRRRERSRRAEAPAATDDPPRPRLDLRA